MDADTRVAAVGLELFCDCENLWSYITHVCILAKFYTGANGDMPISRDFCWLIHGGVARNCSF